MKPPVTSSKFLGSKPKSFLKTLLTPPVYEDRQMNVLAQTLHYLLLLAVVLAGGYATVTSTIADEPSGIIISGGMAFICAILFWILRNNKLKLVSWTLIVSAYIGIMVSLFLNGGIRDEAALVLIAVLPIAGFLLGEVVIPMGVLTAVLFIFLFIAERVAIIPEEEHFFPVGIDELMMALISIFVTTFVLNQITRLMLRKTEEIEVQARFLSEKNLQLEKSQAELIAAKEVAEEANRSRSMLFSRLSHDFRAPLGGILGLASHLMSDGAQLTQDEREEFLQGIHRSGSHLLKLINDLLDISRLEAQQMSLNLEPTPLRVVLSEIVLLLHVSAEEKGVSLQVHIADDVPEVVCADEQRLQQILINLLGNGIKFTDSGEVLLVVSVVGRETAVPQIRFEIIDTGRGIDADDLDRIFDPFVQVGDVAARVEGTGLGLAISRHLVEVMGGALSVESELNQGSRFWFTLALPEE